MTIVPPPTLAPFRSRHSPLHCLGYWVARVSLQRTPLPTYGSRHTTVAEEKWDKTFPQSAAVEHRKVTFPARYGVTLAADLYLPKKRAKDGPPAIVVGGPFGAVEEQSSGLYAHVAS